MSDDKILVEIIINERAYMHAIEPRLLLADYIRHYDGLTGTHIGCEHGICGACTVSVDGLAARSCLMLAVQAEGRSVRTVESPDPTREMQVLREEFHQAHALQCGFCTPGFLMMLEEFLLESPERTNDEIEDVLNGNLCRCTGYVNLKQAVRCAADRLTAEAADVLAALPSPDQTGSGS